MAGKSDKDKQKVLQEKHQAILNELLKEKCNSYCVDCNSKGPRWASWNIGIFICIRCAGIHRNLGVHISRVKSVNLDSWTPEQISVMQQMGNANAKSVYEANLPPNFPAPHTDSALEALIRAKYEYKKYIDKTWTPPVLKVPATAASEPVKKEKKHRNRSVPSRKPQAVADLRSADTSPAIERKKKTKTSKDSEVELLTLDVVEPRMQTDALVAVEDFLQLNVCPTEPDPSTCNGSLVSDFETLDLMDPNSEAPDQMKLGNDAILALYGPPDTGACSSFPGGVYMPRQTSALHGGVRLNSFAASSGFVSGVAPQQVSGSVKSDATPGISSLPISSNWTQPSTVGRTLCTSLWQ